MKTLNIFKEISSRTAVEHYPEALRLTLIEIANNEDYIERLEKLFSKRTKDAVGDCNICTFSVRNMMSILGRDIPPLISPDVSSFFTVINDVPWILINTDINLLEVTLIHESIHFNQWARGDFQPVKGGIIWKGELWTQEKLSECYTPDKISFQWKYLPWELEAYGYQFTDMQIAHIRTYGEPEVKKNLEELLTLAGRVCTLESVEQVTE